MPAQTVQQLPTIPQTWSATSRSDGRFTVTCPPQYLKSAPVLAKLNSVSTDVILQRLLKKGWPSSFLSVWKLAFFENSRPESCSEVDGRLQHTGESPNDDCTANQIVVSATASRHVFVHDIKMTMCHNTFLVVSDLFSNVQFIRDDMNQMYFSVKRIAADVSSLPFYFVSDALGVPVYYLKKFNPVQLERVTIVDAVTNAEACTVDQLGGGKRADGLCIWRKYQKLPWVIVIANRQRTKFDFVEVGTNRVLLVVKRKAVPFAKLCNLQEQFNIHIAPFVDTALAALWVVLTVRSFCL